MPRRRAEMCAHHAPRRGKRQQPLGAGSERRVGRLEEGDFLRRGLPARAPCCGADSARNGRRSPCAASRISGSRDRPAIRRGSRQSRGCGTIRCARKACRRTSGAPAGPLGRRAMRTASCANASAMPSQAKALRVLAIEISGELVEHDDLGKAAVGPVPPVVAARPWRRWRGARRTRCGSPRRRRGPWPTTVRGRGVRTRMREPVRSSLLHSNLPASSACARASCAGVSTPSGTVSTNATSIRIPSSSTRSCSSRSRRSSGLGGSATKRASASRL